jgi:hypothetical protein
VSRHERVYRRLLRLYPEHFTSDYADEMTRLFADQLLDAKDSHEPFAVAGLWIRSIADLMATAPGHHLQRGQPVPQTIDAGPAAIPASHHPAGNRHLRVLIGLLPLWVLVFLLVALPSFMAPMFANPPEVLGLPAGVVIMAIALTVMAIGVAILGLTSSTRAAIVALVGFTAPSLVLLVMAPAMILAIVNLSPQTGG